MPEITFQVLGPNNTPLEVVFKKHNKNLTAHCACETTATDICQHQMTILSGSNKEIISKNSNDIKIIASWIAETDVGKALHDLASCAKALENATDDFKTAKKRLIKALKD